MTELMVAAITAVAAVLAAGLPLIAQMRKIKDEQGASLKDAVADFKATTATAQAVTDAKIDALARQVEKHNGVIERTYKVETDVSNLFHRYEEVAETANNANATASHACERADAAHNRIDRSGIDRD